MEEVRKGSESGDGGRRRGMGTGTLRGNVKRD